MNELDRAQALINALERQRNDALNAAAHAMAAAGAVAVEAAQLDSMRDSLSKMSAENLALRAELEAEKARKAPRKRGRPVTKAKAAAHAMNGAGPSAADLPAAAWCSHADRPDETLVHADQHDRDA
jgi:hypothetical protein